MKTCLVLGAGATLANALHFHGQRDLARNPPLDYTFFEKIAALGIPIPSELRAYSAGSPGIDPFRLRPGQPQVRMEEFFKDLFSDFQEASSGSRTSRAYEQLLSIYLRVLRETTDWIGESSRTGGPVGRLIASIAARSDEVTILTFNHDLMIENEILKRARLRQRWCIEEGYGSLNSRFVYTNPTSGNLFPPHGPGCDHSSPITILKLHGSLNWYVRMNGQHPSRAMLSGSGSIPAVHCTRRRSVPQQLRRTRPGRTGRTGRTTWYTWPVIVPPIHGKEALVRQLVPEAWTDGEIALKAADRLVFVGYSIPMLDVQSERLFKRAISANAAVKWIDVINPATSMAERYAGIAAPTALRWYHSIESFIDIDGFNSI